MHVLVHALIKMQLMRSIGATLCYARSLYYQTYKVLKFVDVWDRFREKDLAHTLQKFPVRAINISTLHAFERYG